MKKRKFNSRAMKEFAEPKVVHEFKPVDFITQYNRMRSIAADIYNSDFYMIATKAEQKKIEASIACISATMISMIGMEAIKNSHDHLPDDSGDDTDTDKDSHDAIKKMMNIAYGKTETNDVKKAAARQALNSMYGATGNMKYIDTDCAPSSIMAMNRKNIGELDAKSPMQILYENINNLNDADSDEDVDDVDIGNFADGPFYSDRYRDICQLYGFDIDETLKRIVKAASSYTISKINLVGVMNDKHDIKSDDKYYPNTGDVFLVTNKENDKDPVFVLIYTKSYLELFDFDIDKVSAEIKPVDLEESTKTNYINFVGSEAYFNIGKVYLNPNSDQVIDLDATLEKIKDEARMHGIDTITFVDTIGNSLDIYTKGKYTLEPGSLFCHRGNGWLNFMLIIKDKNTPNTVRFIWPVEKPEENANLDDIEFIGIDDYYKIDKVYPNSDQVIDLDATLNKVKEKARAKNIKTVTFAGTIKGFYDIFYNYKYYQAGSLFYIKSDERPRFILITGSIDYVNLPQYEHIDPVVVFKKDDSEDESDSKEDGIEAVEAEDEIVDSDEASSDRCINDQYADVDTSKLNRDIYAGVSFLIFMKPTESGKYVNFADICDIYDFDISETIKRIKNVAYQENIGNIIYVDTILSRDEIFRKDENDRYVYGNGSLFLMVNYTNTGKDPYFVILRKMWDGHVSEYISTLYRINPVMKSAKINSVKEINVIDDYADGNVRIAKDLKNIISIDYDYKIKEICEKRNYDYEKMISCLKAVTAIIGGGMFLTFEGTVESLKSIVTVDPVVAYDTCSVFFISAFIDGAERPYFVIYMPITGKTKNGYSFRLYRIRPILKQDPNTDSQDDSNVREINQFTTIYRANSEVSEANKDAYMKIEFSLINHSDGGEIHSLSNICYTWKFKFYDTIKRIRFVAYMNNFKEIKYAGTVCSHEEILEKEVIYNNGSVLFVCDEEDPHFVIVEFINGSTCLNRINPVKE